MQLELSTEQTQLVDLAARWVEREGGWQARHAAGPDGTTQAASRARWRKLAELGLLSLGVPEAHGGLGATAADVLLVMEALGRGAVIEPVVAASLMAPRLLATHAASCRDDGLMSGIAQGTACVVPALHERDRRFALKPRNTEARRDAQGWQLDGEKINVEGGDLATHLVVSARSSDEAQGTLLFLVPIDAAGITRHAGRRIDDSGMADIAMQGVRLDADALIAEGEHAEALLDEALDHGCAALAAQAAGAMSALVEQTVDYLRVRKQFGRTLSQFQVLQHRAVDMLSTASSARAIAMQAAAALEGDPRERSAAASAAKSLVGRDGRTLGERAIQMHGGMGMTDELAAGHYFKRLACIDMAFGDSAWHLQRFMRATAVAEAPSTSFPSSNLNTFASTTP